MTVENYLAEAGAGRSMRFSRRDRPYRLDLIPHDRDPHIFFCRVHDVHHFIAITSILSVF